MRKATWSTVQLVVFIFAVQSAGGQAGRYVVFRNCRLSAPAVASIGTGVKPRLELDCTPPPWREDGSLQYHYHVYEVNPDGTDGAPVFTKQGSVTVPAGHRVIGCPKLPPPGTGSGYQTKFRDGGRYHVDMRFDTATTYPLAVAKLSVYFTFGSARPGPRPGRTVRTPDRRPARPRPALPGPPSRIVSNLTLSAPSGHSVREGISPYTEMDVAPNGAGPRHVITINLRLLGPDGELLWQKVVVPRDRSDPKQMKPSGHWRFYWPSLPPIGTDGKRVRMSANTRYTAEMRIVDEERRWAVASQQFAFRATGSPSGLYDDGLLGAGTMGQPGPRKR